MSSYPKNHYRRASRPRKRRFHGNRYTNKAREDQPISVAAEKSKIITEDVIFNPTHFYRIIEFVSVFASLSDFLICKTCQKDIKFSETDVQAFGFKLVVTCSCGRREINSSPPICNGYEINRKIAFVMRLLGVGYEGLNLFSGLMDIGKAMNNISYDFITEQIHNAAKLVFDSVCQRAVTEEIEKNAANGKPENDTLKVFVGSSWKRRGLSSLFGVTSIIGHYSAKVIDLVVKNGNCEACKLWENRRETDEYTEWYENHREECFANLSGYARKMEVDSIEEIFSRSEEKFQVKYENFSEVTQNSNEIFKSRIWRLAPKHFQSGQMIEIASYIAACLFNEGYNGVLRIMNILETNVGTEAENFAKYYDEQRQLCINSSEDNRSTLEAELVQENMIFIKTEELSYSQEIDD